ncbi:MAG: replicative DNA helicase [Hyphomicrobiales bacterium]|nr:replicative DNA helicase [Hyphomicrobiales bacterium]
MALLGAVLANNLACERVAEFLRPEHFADDRHGTIYAAIGDMIDNGQVADPVTLHARFATEGSLEEIGGSTYIARLAAAAVSIVNVTDYGRTVFDLYQRRQLLVVADNIRAAVHDNAADYAPAGDVIQKAEQDLHDLAERGAVGGAPTLLATVNKAVLDSAQAAHRNPGALAGLPTGLADLDAKMGGLAPSDLIVVAARPSMGKSALAGTIARNAARDLAASDGGGAVVLFSLEMSDVQFGMRLAADRAGLPSERIRRGDLTAGEFDRFIDATRATDALPLYIDDTPGITVAAIRGRARQLKRTRGLRLIIIDYLQLIQPGRRTENRVQEISDMTRGLKILAKELELPVIALSQLSRAVEQRENRRPQLSDLRESGAIEQDADIVLFLYREEYYLEKARPVRKPGETDADLDAREAKWQTSLNRVRNIAEIIIGKQRHGPTGIVRALYSPATTVFDNLAHGPTAADGGNPVKVL